MALHPQAQAVLDGMAAFGLTSGLDAFDKMSAVEAREMMAKMRVPMDAEPIHEVRDLNIPGPLGDIPARLYRASAATDVPVLVWYHGGGWVIGDLDGSDPTCRAISNKTGCAVVSVDYRMAPEYKFPAPLEDCYAATKWVSKHGADLGCDGSRLAVGGDSAGGNLAAAVSIAAAERGGPKISYQLLVYPVTDYNFGTVSYSSNANGYLLTMGSMKWFWNHYLNNPLEGLNHLASPLQKANLAGQPPAMVLTAEFDPLCSEGEAYAARLKAAGVPVEQKRYDGMIHGFFGMAAAMDDAKAAVDQASAALKKAFAL
jgi:acetyl esterase